MTDTSLDLDLDRSERNFAEADARRAALVQPVPKRTRKARLTVEQAAARREEGVLKVEEPTTAVAVPSAPVAPADPGASLRYARLGFVAAAVLVLLLVWIMQRKKGV